jgi:hypothetical protein
VSADDDEDAVDTVDDALDDELPLCDVCGTPLQVAGTDAHPYWICPRCLVVRSA